MFKTILAKTILTLLAGTGAIHSGYYTLQTAVVHLHHGHGYETVYVSSRPIECRGRVAAANLTAYAYDGDLSETEPLAWDRKAHAYKTVLQFHSGDQGVWRIADVSYYCADGTSGYDVSTHPAFTVR